MPSREAEMTAFEVGNATLRTWSVEVSPNTREAGLSLTSSSWPESEADSLYSIMDEFPELERDFAFKILNSIARFKTRSSP